MHDRGRSSSFVGGSTVAEDPRPIGRDQLLERLRGLLAERRDVVEKPMVGGRSFSLRGRMCCGVTSGGLMVRVGRDGVAEALDRPHVSRMAMGGRSLAAFVVVAPPGVASDVQLAAWVQRGVAAVTGESVPAATHRAEHSSPPRSAVSTPPVAIGSAAERFADLVEDFAHTAGVAAPEPGRGRGFGSSALRVDGSIFAMLAGDHLVVKLPRARVDELIDAGAGVAFTAGKTAPMKEWLTVTDERPSTWRGLVQEALVFVGRR